MVIGCDQLSYDVHCDMRIHSYNVPLYYSDAVILLASAMIEPVLVCSLIKFYDQILKQTYFSRKSFINENISARRTSIRTRNHWVYPKSIN